MKTDRQRERERETERERERERESRKEKKKNRRRKVNRSGCVAAHRPPLVARLDSPHVHEIDASRRIGGVERGRCAIYRKIFMGLAVGPCAHVPISHNRRVTNVLLIASSRTETRTGKNRES